VLAALWVAGRPLTPGEVQGALRDELAYTTVMTTLARLHEKGAVERERAGRAFAYTPVLDRAAQAAERMRELLGSTPDREAVLTRFVGSLSEGDEQLLAELLSQVEDEAGGA